MALCALSILPPPVLLLPFISFHMATPVSDAPLCSDPSHLVTGHVPKRSRDYYPLIAKVEKYLHKLKGRKLQRQTQRQEWVIRENIRQKLLEKHFPAFYGPNRDGPCEWLGSKRDIERLDAMEDLLIFTHKVTQPLASPSSLRLPTVIARLVASLFSRIGG